MTKRTYSPSKKRKARRHGFKRKMSSLKGKNIIKRRRNKGRKRLIP
jgi:large subunit ribosomal protein L34